MTEFNTSMPMTKCAGCGAEFATVKQIEKVRHFLPAGHDKIALCPTCRRAAFRDAAEHALIK
jgi:uncharacterized protein with PIN domain